LEKNNYFSENLNKRLATNWVEIPKDSVVALELYWKGTSAVKVALQDIPHGKPDNWYFSHTGAVDLTSKDNVPKVLSRNIGYEKEGIINIYKVKEDDGTVTFESRRKT
jgi:hypothetical protein